LLHLSSGKVVIQKITTVIGSKIIRIRKTKEGVFCISWRRTSSPSWANWARNWIFFIV